MEYGVARHPHASVSALDSSFERTRIFLAVDFFMPISLTLTLSLTTFFSFNLPAVDCGSLEAPENGRVQYSSTTLGSPARYTCFNGFIREGAEIRICKITGIWTPAAPICIRTSNYSSHILIKRIYVYIHMLHLCM